MGATAWFFVKVFDDERWADAFIQGKVRLNRLGYFKKLEAEECADDDARPDEHEGLSHWFQPKGLNIKLTTAEGKVIDLSPDLASPVAMAYSYHTHLNVLCLYTMRTIDIPFEGTTFDCTGVNAAKLREQLWVSERIAKFGRYAVLIAVPQFLERMEKVLTDKGHKFAHNLVHYYDDESFSGPIPPQYIPFHKQKRFSYQNEYRIVVDTENTDETPLDLDIGNISAFARKVDPMTLNEAFKLDGIKSTD